jgi:hypothetical protein
MTTPHDDWHDWKRLHAIECSDQPRPWWRGLAELVWVALVVGLLAAWAARCWAPAPAVAPLRAAERAAVARAAQLVLRVDSLRHVVDAATARADSAEARYRRTRRAVRSVTVDTAPPDMALPDVPGGWGTVTDGELALPAPRAVIGALIARDSALTLADAALSEHRLALQRWAVAGTAFLAERQAHLAAVAAVEARWRAEVAEAKRSRWRWLVVGVAIGAGAAVAF